MELLDSHGMRALPRGDGPLLGLGDAFSSRFHSWHGLSGRRYVFSVFPMTPDGAVPDFEPCLIMPVEREGVVRRVTGVFIIERGSDRRVVAAAAARGCDEWHVHLLAGDRRERASVAADLRARHGGAAAAIA